MAVILNLRDAVTFDRQVVSSVYYNSINKPSGIKSWAVFCDSISSEIFFARGDMPKIR
jgi:hypothetical protein